MRTTRTHRYPLQAALAASFTIAFLAGAARAFAQDEATIPGRNAALKAAFKDVVAKSDCAARISSGGSARGYGVLLDGGFVVTTAAIAHGDLTVKTRSWKGKARVLGVDKDTNLAVLKLDEAPAGGAKLGTSASLEIGQFVVCAGASEEPIAVGVLSAKDRRVEPRDMSGNFLFGLMSDGNDGPKRHYSSVLQHDAPMTADTLGSPLLDRDGNLIGVNVDTAYRGSAYAIAIDDAKPVIERLKKGEAAAPRATESEKKAEKPASKPRLGLAGRALTDDEKEKHHVTGGVFVDELQGDGPSGRAGIHAGDIVVAIDGAPIASLDELAAKVGEKKPGDKIVVSVKRGKKKVDLTVELGSSD